MRFVWLICIVSATELKYLTYFYILTILLIMLILIMISCLCAVFKMINEWHATSIVDQVLDNVELHGDRNSSRH